MKTWSEGNEHVLWTESSSRSFTPPPAAPRHPVDGVKTLPLLMCLRPALVCICKYSISDICCLIFKSDQDTTAAEAIHKEAHIFVLLLFFFVGMELVLTKPTKPTCKFMHWIKGYLSFFLFCLFCLLQVCMMVCRTTNRERKQQRRETEERRERETKKGRKVKRSDRVKKRQTKVWSGSMILVEWFLNCRVCCDRYRWILLRCATVLTVSELLLCCWFSCCLFLISLKQRSTTVTWSYKHVRRNKKCRLA